MSSPDVEWIWDFLPKSVGRHVYYRGRDATHCMKAGIQYTILQKRAFFLSENFTDTKFYDQSRADTLRYFNRFLSRDFEITVRVWYTKFCFVLFFFVR